MIKLRLNTIIFIGFILLLSYCKKDLSYLNGTATTNTSGGGNTTTNPVSNQGDFVTFKVDGVAKNSVSQVATVYASSGNSFQIIAKINGTEVFSILVNSLAVNTFDVVKNNAILAYGLDSTFPNTYTATAGTVTITSYTSDTVAGTFQFTGSNLAGATKAITEGSFSCKYIKL